MSGKKRNVALSLLAAGALLGALTGPALRSQPAPRPEPDRLAVLWTSGDPDVAHRVCLMYTHAAHKNKWFDEVRLIVWGPSANLLANDPKVQGKVKAMMADGMKVEACIACANSYGVTGKLRELGLEVRGMGQPLSTYLKEDWHVISF